jgi:hypothetical protein
MLPIISRNDLPNKRLRNPELCGQASLGGAASRVRRSDFAHLAFRKLGLMVRFASDHSLNPAPARPVVIAFRDVLRAGLRPMSLALNHVGRVFFGGSRDQMMWIAARWIVASMPKHQPIRNFTIDEHVRKTVSADRHPSAIPISIEEAVPTIHLRAFPYPAPIFDFLYFCPKGLDVGFGVSKFHGVTQSMRRLWNN